MKIFTESTWEKMQKDEEFKKHWIGFLSAQIMNNYGYYRTAKYFCPEKFTKDADKTLASMALDDFKELCELDKGTARMVFEWNRAYFTEMIETVGEDVMDYLKLFYE